MRWMQAMRARLGLLRRGAAEERMDDEMRFHLEMATDKYVRAGMSPDEARRRAVLDFGGLEGHKEEMRGGRTFAWAGGLGLDLKLGFRMLRKYPGLTAVGGVAIAFAVWVGASAFEFLGQVVHPTLPLPDGGRIVAIRQWDAAANESRSPAEQDFAAWRGQLRTVDEVGAFRASPRNLVADGLPIRPVQVTEMTASGFRVARTPPLLGRTLVDDDERPGAAPVVVLGYALWRGRFGGDRDIIGRQVRLGSTPHTVVGVMPRKFAFPVADEIWTPLRTGAADDDASRVRVFGRLARGASIGEARAELATLGRRAAADFPGTHRHLLPRVVPYASSFLDLTGAQSAGVLSLNLFLVGLLVLVCGNVALLMFARAATREGEIVVRNALGASRRRIIAQLFTEALVLAVVAALVGLVAARWGLRVAHGLVVHEVLDGNPLPFWFHAGLSPLTVAYALGLAALAAVIAGVVPALRVTRGLGTRLRQASAGGGGGFRFGGLWTAVIVTQVALTVLFPVEAFFAQRSVGDLRSADVGFAEEEFLTARLQLGRDAEADTSRTAMLARYATMVGELERRLEADPAVEGVALADWLPRMYHPGRRVQVDEGAVAVSDAPLGHPVSAAAVSTDFFGVLGAPILAGRGFDAGDSEGARVVVVNQSFVRLVLNGRNPVGRRVRLLPDEGDPAAAGGEPWYEVVGVVPDMGMSFGEDPRVAGLYHPVAPGGTYPAHVAVRLRSDPAAFAPRLAALAASIDPALQIHDVLPMDERSNAEIRFTRTWFWIVIVVSSVALLLSLAGIYAVMAFTVSQRTREIGIRVALGADARRIVVAIFRRPLTQVAVGIVIGGALTGAVIYAASGSLTLRGAGLLLAHMGLVTGVCLLACIVPTRRALGVEPMEALRAE